MLLCKTKGLSCRNQLMMKNGIIDPVKVTNSALVNASSVAATLLTTEAAVAQIKEAAPAAQPNPEMDY